MTSGPIGLELEHLQRALDQASRCAVELGRTLPAQLAAEIEQAVGFSGRPPSPASGAGLLRAACFVAFEALLARTRASRGADSSSEGDSAASRRRADYLGAPVSAGVRTRGGEPVEELAERVLAALASGGGSALILDPLEEAARDLVDSRSPASPDILGRVYQRVLQPGVGDAYSSYYTGFAAARLLAELVVGYRGGAHTACDPGEPGREGAARPKLPVVLDPACGSGVLLLAAYAALRSRWVAPHVDAGARRSFHQRCVREALHGWEVMPFGTRLTRSALALLGRDSPEGCVNIVNLAAGPGACGRLRLGALDALAPTRADRGGQDQQRPSVTALTEDGCELEIDVPRVDVVIMNPPFSRSAKPNVKFGYVDARTRARMDSKLRAVGRGLGLGGIGHAGLAAYFVVLAHQLLERGGRVAVVLPRSCLSGVSWAGVRELILREYQLEFVVANADAGCADDGIEPWNWSDRTDLGEVMWVARKAEAGATREPVRYANLWRKPRNERESVSLAAQIAGATSVSLPDGQARPLMVDGETAGAVYSVAQEVLDRNWLFPCLFADARLNALVHEWVVRPPVETIALGTLLAGIGPDIAQVKRAFDRAELPTAYPMVWGHQGAMDRMSLDERFVGFGSPRAGSCGGELHRRHAATLLLAERPHLHSEAMLVIQTAVPVLSSAFWELRPAGPELADVLQLWFQSTFGFIAYLSQATSSRGDIFKLKKGQLGWVPVVLPRLVGRAPRELAAELRGTSWLRFPEEFARAARGEGPRKAIDDFLIRRLGLRAELTPYYEALATDPVVTARPGAHAAARRRR